MNIRQVWLVAGLWIALGGFSSAWAGPGISTVIKGNTAFAMDLYAQLKAESGGMAFSPYSLSTALAMTYAGARENTELQMTQALHISLGRDRFHQAFGQLARKLEESAKSGGYEFLTANSLWVQMGYGLTPEFLDVLEKTYGTRPQEADFASNPEAQRVSINRWVEGRTQSRIKDLIASGMITDMTRLVLVNALYFKGQWASKFNTEATRRENFVTSSGAKVSVPLMNQTSELLYGEDDETQVIALPYHQNKFSMVFILPRRAGLGDLEKNLTGEKLDRYIDGLQLQKVKVAVPRFRAETAFLLNDKLKSLGMTDAFDESRADFSGMDGRKDLYISYVIHKALVEVDESGSEAAAATAVTMTLKSMPREESPPKVFRADHPFIFFIRDNETGSILFMGRVTDPSKS